MKKHYKYILALLLILTSLAGCSVLKSDGGDKAIIHSNEKKEAPDTSENGTTNNINPGSVSVKPTDEEQPTPKEPKLPQDKLNQDAKKPGVSNENAIQVVGEPEAITVLVNKQNKLPDNYEPKDLVYPDVRFIFNGKLDKRKMRAEAADALEAMFAGAEKDGIFLAGVSGYRSKATQEVLYNRYVKRDGKKAADRYSARPGHSEHQTGLTMDISGSTGKCAAQDCFGDTKEAKWLADYAYEYGFIIRYPEGKEQITGYKYEPWHLRFVGMEISKEVHEKDITLEEYFNIVVPVDGKS